jgi:hypothetical protein
VPRLRSLLFGALGLAVAAPAAPQVTVSVDAGADQHPIDPRIYGVAFADPAALDDLGATLNRWGGNTSSRYNWQQNIDNRGADWFFESLVLGPNVPGQSADSFISESRAGGAEPMLTFPMCDWIAKAGPGYTDLWSFSVAKYGPQQSTDIWRPDAGNGMVWDGQDWVPITWNDRDDANTPNSGAHQQGWFQHVVATWGPASASGLKYWFYDNEPSIWFATHRDVVRQGKHDDEYIALVKDYGSRARQSDPSVKLFGPEEWGWSAYFYSGYDLWYGPDHGWDTPDHDLHGDFIPYLLGELRLHEQNTGERLLDGLTLHFYPQAGQFSEDVSTSMQLLRNRSTRSLWDPGYVDESWIGEVVRLIPRMKEWVAADYPGLLTGITEYNWGAEDHMNGATTQADILGIFGREGLDLATRWTTPEPSTPTYKAMKMFRNYDGGHSAFGDTSVSATAPDPDTLSAFAAQRASDGALTVMAVNKSLSGSTPLLLNLAGFTPGATAQRWQLASNAITQLADVPVSGSSLQATLPAPSVTLFVIPSASVPLPTISVSDASVAEGDAGTTDAAFPVTLSAASASPVSVNYATSDGSATAGSDYTSAAGTISFAPGSTSAVVLVPVLGDTVPEGLETFDVTLSAPVSATLGDASAVGTIVDDDGGAPLLLELAHGFSTTRDFGAGSAHLFRLRQAPRSSYEVVVDGLSGDVGAAGPLVRLLASDLATVLSDSLPVGTGKSRSLAWENASGSAVLGEYVLVQSAGCSACAASDAYRIRAYDTTASVARFNNSGNQVSVLVLENRAGRTLSGNAHFWSPQGALLASSPFTLASGAVSSLNTSTVPGLPGQSGSVTVSHDGRYGDLAGKAVAVEPSTGFTFDTLLGHRPR